MEHRLWQHTLGHDLVTQMHDHRIAAGHGFGCDPQRFPLQKKQQTSLGSGLLDRGAHQRLDQLFQNDFARHGLRHLDDRREVQMLNRRPDRGRRAGNSLVLPEVRMKLLELPHLAVGSPAKIPVAGVAQIEMRDLLKATRGVEARGQFIGERLILHEGIVARRADCLLIETLGVKFPAFEVGNLRVDQCDAILEVLGAIVRPDLELLLMCSHRLQVLLPVVGRSGPADCRVAERRAEVIFNRLRVRERPQQGVRAPGGIESRLDIARHETRLQLPDPIIGRGPRQGSASGQLVLKLPLIELSIVKSTEGRRQAAESPNQPELRGDEIDEEPEMDFPCEFEAILGLALRLGERIARRQHVPDQVGVAVGGVNDVSVPGGDIDTSAHQLASRLHVLSPWHDQVPEHDIDAGLEALQSASFDQLVPQATEFERGLVLAEACTGNDRQPLVGQARSIAVAALEGQIDRVGDDEHFAVLVSTRPRRFHLVQDVHGRQRSRIAHQRQFDKVIDRAAAEPGQDPLVFASSLVFGGMGRPVNAHTPEVVETDLDGAAALTESRVDIHAQAGDGGAVNDVGGSLPKNRQPFIGCCQCAGHKLALCTVEFERERKCATPLQAVVRQQRATGSEVGEGRAVGRRLPGAPAREQIEFG